MSDTSVNTVVYSNRFIVRLFLGAVFVAGLLLILPLYMQNRLNSLYSTSHELSKEVGRMQREILLQDKELNHLTSLERLSPIATEMGLDLNAVPTKIRILGGAR